MSRLVRSRPLEVSLFGLLGSMQIINLLIEGCSVRSVVRLTGVHKRTVLTLLRTVGDKCERLGLRPVN